MKPALLASAALVAVTALALPSQAAPKPQITDAKGDSVDTSSAHDVVSVLFTQTKKNGALTGFDVALTLAGPQSDVQGVNYLISAQTANCGEWSINWSPNTALGSRDQVTMQCGEPGSTGDPYTIINVAPRVKGNVLTWRFSRKMFPEELRKGDTFTDLAVTVQQNEPVMGIIGASVFTNVADYDSATSDASFRW